MLEERFPKLDIRAARALRPNIHTIVIDSVLGGHGAATHFAGKGQFRASVSIDPAQPIDDSDGPFSTEASGLIRPTSTQKVSGTTITSAPIWMVPNPKDANTYVYDANGSMYAMDNSSTFTALADGGTLTSSLGNGAEYYDNYIYLAKNTDIARYGPLNGAPVFTGSYWVTTLGKAALTNTAYPTTQKNRLQLPNHVMHRHFDGKLYIADVVGNQGYIHYIATSKTTVEGDTNNGSTANKLGFGYGLWPTAIESYGAGLVISLIETDGVTKKDMPAKLAFWDTVASSANQITWVEYPDPIITAIKNANGALYIFSSNYHSKGFRVMRYIGGYSFKEVYYSETGEPPLAGAVSASLNRIMWGGYDSLLVGNGCVWAKGLQQDSLGSGIFNIMAASGGNTSTCVTSLLMTNGLSGGSIEFGFETPTIGWTQAGDGSTSATHGVDKQGTQYNNATQVWWSQLYKIGSPFKVNKITIPVPLGIVANNVITPSIYTDSGQLTYAGVSSGLPTIDSTGYLGKKHIVLRPIGVTGDSDLMLGLSWTGSVLATVGLPIHIEIELIPA